MEQGFVSFEHFIGHEFEHAERRTSELDWRLRPGCYESICCNGSLIKIVIAPLWPVALARRS